MKCAALSDTHGRHEVFEVPPADVFIHAGDFSDSGTLHESREFLGWMSALPHPHKLLIAGNHDLGFERDRVNFEALLPSGITYLRDSSVEINGVCFYGTPWTPRFYDWAFMLARGEEINCMWERIPDRTDVLISHGPPAGVLDLLPDGVRVGCDKLLQHVQTRVKPQFHLFGHIHECGGQVERQDAITYLNLSMSIQEFEVSTD